MPVQILGIRRVSAPAASALVAAELRVVDAAVEKLYEVVESEERHELPRAAELALDRLVNDRVLHPPFHVGFFERLVAFDEVEDVTAAVGVRRENACRRNDTRSTWRGNRHLIRDDTCIRTVKLHNLARQGSVWSRLSCRCRSATHRRLLFQYVRQRNQSSLDFVVTARARKDQIRTVIRSSVRPSVYVVDL